MYFPQFFEVFSECLAEVSILWVMERAVRGCVAKRHAGLG